MPDMTPVQSVFAEMALVDSVANQLDVTISAATAGNLLVAVCCGAIDGGGNPAGCVVNTPPSGFTEDVGSSTNNANCQIFSKTAAGGETTLSFIHFTKTLTNNGAVSVTVYEIPPATFTLSDTDAGSGASTSVLTTTPTATTEDDVFCCYGIGLNNGVTNPAADNSFSVDNSLSGTIRGFEGSKVLTAAEVLASTLTWTNNRLRRSCIAAYETAGGGGGGGRIMGPLAGPGGLAGAGGLAGKGGGLAG